MGIAQSVSEWLKSLGHDAVHLNDEGLYKLSDNFILEKAAKENRVILTTDMDFGQLLAFNKPTAGSSVKPLEPAVVHFLNRG